jgi:hypothetical protein
MTNRNKRNAAEGKPTEENARKALKRLSDIKQDKAVEEARFKDLLEEIGEKFGVHDLKTVEEKLEDYLVDIEGEIAENEEQLLNLTGQVEDRIQEYERKSNDIGKF